MGFIRFEGNSTQDPFADSDAFLNEKQEKLILTKDNSAVAISLSWSLLACVDLYRPAAFLC